MDVMETVGRSTHWRAGIDTAIAVLRQEPDQLEGYGLRFEDDCDDLDYLRHARLETGGGKVFALGRHRGAPKPGTEVVTRDDSATFLEDLEDVLAQLRLTRDDLVWEHPTIRATREAEALFPDVFAAVRAVALVTAVSVIGAGLVALFASSDHARLLHVVVGIVLVANLLAAAMIVRAYRRMQALVPPAAREGLIHLLRRVWSRRRTSAGRPAA